MLDALSNRALVHVAGHASFTATSPLDAGLELADGRVTARDIVVAGGAPDVLVLSACETGATGALAGEEHAGLGAAFHIAGVRTIVASLWKVDDPATARLMEELYGAWLGGADLARSLADAAAAVAALDGDGAARRDARPPAAPQPAAAQQPAGRTALRDPFVLSGDWTLPPPHVGRGRPDL